MVMVICASYVYDSIQHGFHDWFFFTISKLDLLFKHHF
jgi:hypothetical protein